MEVCPRVRPSPSYIQVLFLGPVPPSYGSRLVERRHPYAKHTASVFLAYGSNLILSSRDLYHSSSIPEESSFCWSTRRRAVRASRCQVGLQPCSLSGRNTAILKVLYSRLDLATKSATYVSLL
ncbi:hypothetical protein LX36DRAFT_741277 [Colletotrichum falcatum]|nr:hypothetical protein LX36DRAFT_741277 [Colletotrichum falcatum]